MAEWIPKPVRTRDPKGVKLGVTEEILLTLIDGVTPVEALAQFSDMPEAEVEKVLATLERHGAIEPRSPVAVARPVAAGAPKPSAPAPEPAPEAEAGGESEAPGEPESEADAESDAEAPPSAEEIAAAGSHRKLFETRLHSLTADDRATRASGAVEPELSAFCFDPLPAVVKRVLENPGVGLTHARLIAAHHPNPVGLEALAARGAFYADRQVQQLLLRNLQCPLSLVRRIVGHRRLLEMYKAGQSRDYPDKTRQAARDQMRNRFNTASADEKVELIFATEGRSLSALSGLALDGKSTSMLCARPYASIQLIQNLARWGATPPALIAHLLRQPVVRRMPQLRNQLLRHSNRPAGESGG